MTDIDYNDLIWGDLHKICEKTIKLGHGVDIPNIIKELTTYWATLPLMLVIMGLYFLIVKSIKPMIELEEVKKNKWIQNYVDYWTDVFFDYSDELFPETNETVLINNLCIHFDDIFEEYRLIYVYPSIENMDKLLTRIHLDKPNLIILFPTEELYKNLGSCYFLGEMIVSEFTNDVDQSEVTPSNENKEDYKEEFTADIDLENLKIDLEDIRLFIEKLENASTTSKVSDEKILKKLSDIKNKFIDNLKNRLERSQLKYKIIEVSDLIDSIPDDKLQEFIEFWITIRDDFIGSIEVAYDDELTYINFQAYLNKKHKKKIVKKYSLQILNTRINYDMSSSEYRKIISNIGDIIELFLKEYYGYTDESLYEIIEELRQKKEISKVEYNNLRHLNRMRNSAKHDPHFETSMETAMSIYYIAEDLLKKYIRKLHIKSIL